MSARHKTYIAVLLAAVLLLAAALVGAYLYLPRYVETRLIPELARTAGLDVNRVRVGRIGFSGAELGPVRLDGPGGPVLMLERLALDYTPAALLQRRIGRIRLEGLRVSLRIADGALFLGDTRLAPAETAPGPSREPAQIPALPFRQLTVADAVLDLAWDARRLQVPFSASAEASGDQGHWTAEVRLTPGRSRLHATAALDAAGRRLNLEIEEVLAPLEEWLDLVPPRFVPASPAPSIRGRLAARGGAALSLNPLTLGAADAQIALEALDLAWAPPAEPPGAPPSPTVGARLEASASLSGDQTPDGWMGRYTVEIGDLKVIRSQSTLRSPLWRFSGEALLGGATRIDLEGEGGDTVLQHETTALTIPRTLVAAQIQRSASGFAVRGRGEIQAAELADTDHELRMRDIAVALPFAWPAAGPAAAPAAGHLDIGRIDLQQHELGALAGIVQQSGRGLRFDLAHTSQLFPGLRVHIEGAADDAGAHAEIDLPQYWPPAAVDLGRFAPAAAGLSLGGRFQAKSRVRWSADGPQTRADIRIDEGVLRDADSGLDVTGIQGRLQLDDLIALHSPADQSLQAGHIRLGKIEATALEVKYRIAPPQRLLIDKAGLDWCGGRLESGPIELNPDMLAVSAVFTARDLNLAMLLEQLDLAEGSGQGTLRGRIPIRWKDGELSFGKGSLSSPPGQTGVIRLKEMQGTQDLLATLPAETPQHTQLDIAMEALKDYTYRSIDLRLESREEILVMQLQLDGKPNRLLPFAYDQELGRLKRIQGEGRAEFQGIDIDLNFRSPINEILNYRELLKTR